MTTTKVGIIFGGKTAAAVAAAAAAAIAVAVSAVAVATATAAAAAARQSVVFDYKLKRLVTFLPNF